MRLPLLDQGLRQALLHKAEQQRNAYTYVHADHAYMPRVSVSWGEGLCIAQHRNHNSLDREEQLIDDAQCTNQS